MNIFYIHQYFNTPAMPGSSRSYEFAKKLVANGHKVFIVTTNWQGATNSSYTKEKGIDVYWAPIKYSNKMSYFKRVLVFLQFLWYVFSLGQKLNYDLIIASSTPLTVGIPTIILRRIKKVKVIFEIRDLWPQLPIAVGAIKSKILIYISELLEKTIYNNSDHIICLSTGMEAELKLRGIKQKVSVITNLSDIERFQKISKTKDNLIQNFDELDKKLSIVYTGSFGRINGVVYILEIAKEMKLINPDICFFLFGNGYEYDEILKKAINNDLLSKSVFIQDYLPKDLMPLILSSSTITSSFFKDIPEMNNNSANKFFDGLAAGKPIMINYSGWQADLLKKTGSGFIIPNNDPKSAAKKINSVITNKKNITSMSNASKKLAYEFDINNNYKKLEEVIDKVIKSKK